MCTPAGSVGRFPVCSSPKSDSPRAFFGSRHLPAVAKCRDHAILPQVSFLSSLFFSCQGEKSRNVRLVRLDGYQISLLELSRKHVSRPEHRNSFKVRFVR